MPSNKYTFYWLLFTVTILFTLVPFLITEGMFMDGLFYSTISRNLAFGIGEPFKPYLTEYFGPVFYEHPFLGFLIQSVMYRVFGDSVYLDKFYCLLIVILQAILIIKIWLKLGFALKDSFLPLLLYFTVNVVFWGYGNNALEITMSVFSTAAVLFLLQANSFSFIISGILISLGMLVKGPVALFPLAFLGIKWLVNGGDRMSFFPMLKNSFFILLGVIFTFSLLYLYQPAWNAFNQYLNIQLFSSVSGNREVAESRFVIIDRLWQELLIMMILSLVLALLAKCKKIEIKISNNAFLFILIGLSASLPILISPKQMGFYLIPAFSMFAIGFAIFIAPILEKLTFDIENWKVPNAILVIFLTLAFYYNISIVGTIGRDFETISDVKKIITIVPKKSNLDFDSALVKDYSLIGNMYRLNYNSLDYSSTDNNYFISLKNQEFDTTMYRLLLTDLDKYQLLGKR